MTSLNQASKSNAVLFNYLSWHHKYCPNSSTTPRISLHPSINHPSFHPGAKAHKTELVVLKYRRSLKASRDWQNDNSTSDNLSISVTCGLDIYIFTFLSFNSCQCTEVFVTDWGDLREEKRGVCVKGVVHGCFPVHDNEVKHFLCKNIVLKLEGALFSLPIPITFCFS